MSWPEFFKKHAIPESMVTDDIGIVKCGIDSVCPYIEIDSKTIVLTFPSLHNLILYCTVSLSNYSHLFILAIFASTLFCWSMFLCQSLRNFHPMINK